MITHSMETNGFNVTVHRHPTEPKLQFQSAAMDVPKDLDLMQTALMVEVLTQIADMPAEDVMQLIGLAKAVGLAEKTLKFVSYIGAQPDVAGEFAMLLMHALTDAALELPDTHPLCQWMIRD